MAEMEDDRTHTQNRIGKTIITQRWLGHQKGREREEDQKPHGGVQWRRSGEKRVGNHGTRHEWLQRIGRDGENLWRPYVPRGTQETRTRMFRFSFQEQMRSNLVDHHPPIPPFPPSCVALGIGWFTLGQNQKSTKKNNRDLNNSGGKAMGFN